MFYEIANQIIQKWKSHKNSNTNNEDQNTVTDPQMGGDWGAVLVMAECDPGLNPGTGNEH